LGEAQRQLVRLALGVCVMKTVTIVTGILSAAVLVFASSMAQQTPEEAARIARLPKAEKLAEGPAQRLQAMGTKVFGLKWEEKHVALTDRGFEVITDGTTTLSFRPAGNAYFVQTAKKGIAEKKPFEGPNEKMIERGRAILAGLAVNPKEIAETKVLQQFTTSGIVDSATHVAKVEPPRKDRRTLLVTRTLEGMPVWNSKLALDLDETGRIAALEMSWPKIKSQIMEEAVRLRRKVEGGFIAPELKGAKVQSMQAGILHSPAASFVDEQVAAIRVIYAPEDSKLGMKPVLYLGADGRPVKTPRQLNPREEAPTKARPLTTAPQPK
jgi:hypothetical protein